MESSKRSSLSIQIWQGEVFRGDASNMTRRHGTRKPGHSWRHRTGYPSLLFMVVNHFAAGKRRGSIPTGAVEPPDNKEDVHQVKI